MRCLIVSGGNPPKDDLFLKEVSESDYLIAADKGAEVFIKNNITPNLAVGDFDSINKEHKELIKNWNTIEFNPEKNLTDSEIAILEAIKKDFKEIIMLGFTGTRIDHTIANLGLLKKALDKNIKAYIIDGNNRVFMVNKPTILKGDFGQLISFQAFGNVKNFCIKNAKYELKNYDLNFGDPRTVSNEFIENDIEITFTEGEVLVIYPRD